MSSAVCSSECSLVSLLLQPNLITLLCYQLVEFVHSTSNLIQGQRADEGNDMEEAPVPGEHLGKRRILVKCRSLTLRLTAQNSAGQLAHVSRKVTGFVGRPATYLLCPPISFLSSPSPSFLQVEPFFVSLALYDASKGLKVSEDFHVDLNDFHLRSLLEKQSTKSLNSNNSGSTQQVGASGLEPRDQWPTLAQQVGTELLYDSETITCDFPMVQ